MECPKDIVDYYWHWFHQETGKKLNKPRFGSHISVIRGNENANRTKEEGWYRHHEKTIAFEYTNEMETNGDYWWLPVKCPFLHTLREEIGLEKEPPFGLHLTIGRENP